jgi:6-phosphogluconolactonase (cycloisomerase 2 family)
VRNRTWIASIFSVVIFGSSAATRAAPANGKAAARHAVFVQTNAPAGNAIAVYDRNHDGTLTFAASYPTGGSGGRAVGAPSDPLASQHSLVYDQSHRLLFAVNAGSDSVSVFDVDGDQLELTQVAPSGGPFPVSIAVRDNLAYVLDAGLAGFVSGFRIDRDHLEAIEGSTRTLGLANTNPPFFLSSPAQVGFSPNGKNLIVTTKSFNMVDVFEVGHDGQLSAQPVRNLEAPVPFPFVFGPADLLVLVNAGNSSVATFRIDQGGTLVPAGTPVSDGQMAACWIVSAHEFEYVANTGSNDISQYRVRGDGTVTLVNPTAASGIPGATDMTTANGGKFLYVLSGTSSTLYAYRVEGDGSLTFIQTVPVPDGANMEGIAAN